MHNPESMDQEETGMETSGPRIGEDAHGPKENTLRCIEKYRNKDGEGMK